MRESTIPSAMSCLNSEDSGGGSLIIRGDYTYTRLRDEEGEEAMRMNWFNLLVGLFFVMLGLGMILKVFGINLPLARVVVALFIIFIGVKIMLPRSFSRRAGTDFRDGQSVVFSDSTVEHKDASSAEYSVV